MPQERRNSEKDNKENQMAFLSEFFNTDNVLKSQGKVIANYYDGIKKIRIIETILLLHERPIELIFKLQNRKKYDYVVNDSVFVEVKQSGDLLCETLSLDKTGALFEFIKICKSLRLDPLEVNEKAIQNFIEYHSEKYIKDFLSNIDFKRTPDFIFLVDENRVIPFEEFEKNYKIVCKSGKNGGTPYSRIKFEFVKRSMN